MTGAGGDRCGRSSPDASILSIYIANKAILFYHNRVRPNSQTRRLRKVTYSLPADLIDDLREVVRNGAAASYSSFVERALAEGVSRAREAQLAAAFNDAGSDPVFLDDVNRALGEIKRANDGSDRLG
jgi:Arc/MetJ-type ribon-helix-helix transcriptional regulator